MAGVAFFLVFFLARVMVAHVAFHICAFMDPVAFLVKDKGFSIHHLDVFVNLLFFLFDVAFVTVDRAFVFIRMAFNAEGVEQFCPGEALVAEGAFFYPFIIAGFMMARYASDVRFLMDAVGHFNANGGLQGLHAPGCISVRVIVIDAGNGHNIGTALIVGAG